MSKKIIRRIHGRFEVTCQQCSKVFLVPAHRAKVAQFCSKECGDVSRRTDVSITCKHCGKEFMAKQCYLKRGGGQYCSRHCWRLATLLPVHEVRLRGKCERCGWYKVPDVLQIHHKDTDRKNNTLENLELLCPNCHEVEHFLTKTGPYWRNGRRTARLEKTRSLLKEAMEVDISTKIQR